MPATKRRIALDIVATDTHCSGDCQMNLDTLPGGNPGGDFCAVCRTSLKRGYHNEIMRLPQCIAATDLVIDEVQQAVTEEVEHTADHNCACHPNRKTKLWYWCDADGTHNPKGTHTCCGICDANCGQTRSAAAPKLPIMPPCPAIEDHLKNCGGAKVCPACHHPCP